MNEFLGRGWSFPVATDSSGAIELVEGETDIEQSIRIILETAPGERVMRPDFGCGIHDYVFETVDATTRTLIESEIEDALTRWEPRIEVLSVAAEMGDRREGRLDVVIEYRIRRTNGEFNMVYPFYVGGR
ncbi:GPW/gp25 family protein [Halopenitus sp. H-Gu1]|uniref:GPW/gp25 family protein n=1 Tax=Halopenitus sp. H-Gu1 TaxID=3242697 RepID=UPI00359EC178